MVSCGRDTGTVAYLGRSNHPASLNLAFGTRVLAFALGLPFPVGAIATFLLGGLIPDGDQYGLSRGVSDSAHPPILRRPSLGHDWQCGTADSAFLASP